MRLRHTSALCLALSSFALIATGCGDIDTSEEGLSTEAPTRITRLPLNRDLSAGFKNPGDAVASPDGTTFYFLAQTLDLNSTPAIYSVPSEGGTVARLTTGNPLADPTGLVMSCDGATLYVADMGDDLENPGDDLGGKLYTFDLDNGVLTQLDTEGIGVPSGLAMDDDCQNLYVTGHTPSGEPALFALSPEGGAATVVKAGEPLESPSGVHVDVDNVAWVMDQVAEGSDGPGTLFAITPDGETQAVLSDLRMGAPGGVSLAAGGRTAVIPDVDEAGKARLVTVDTATGERKVVPATDMVRPAGIRTARKASIFVITDTEGNAIFRAE